MGKGDKKTAKGKRAMGSHGNTRPKGKSIKSDITQGEKPKKVTTPKKNSTSKKASSKKPQEN
jgi:30S ribosomal protein S31